MINSITYWSCRSCDIVLVNEYKYYDNCGYICISHTDDRIHNTDVHGIDCPCCSSPMKWNDKNAGSRNIDAAFDYVFQVFRSNEGKALKLEGNASFSCCNCFGPADYTGCTSYYEYYKCRNCGHNTSVN